MDRYTLHRAADGVTYDDGRAMRTFLVAVDGWAVSYRSLSRALSSPSVAAADDGMVILRMTHDGVPSELDGTKYSTQEEASRAAYAAGALAWMIYDGGAR